MKIQMILLFCLVLLSQLPAEAKVFRHSFAPKYLSNYIEKQLKSMEDGLAKSDEESETRVKSNEGGKEAWYFSRFKIRLDPFVEFEVPFASFKIFPIIELDWVKGAPQGWREYRPR